VNASHDYALDIRRVRRDFDRAAPTYDTAAVLHAEVRENLLQRLDWRALEPRAVMDAGAGTGHACAALRRRYPKSLVVALDFSPRMLQAAARQQTWLRGFSRVCGDAERLPLADGSIDLILSNLMLQWCDPDRVFAEFRRVLAPNGLLTFTTLFHGTMVNGNAGARGGHVPVPCDTQLVRWKADVDAFHPDVVMLADGEYEVRDQRISGTWQHIGSTDVDTRELRALTDATRVLGSTGATVVLLTAPYYQQVEQDDGQPWPEDDPVRADRYNTLLRQAAAGSHGRVVVADLGARLDPGGHFTSTIDGTQVRYSDGIHVTAAGATLVSPWLLTRAVQLGTTNRAAQVAPSTRSTTAGPS